MFRALNGAKMKLWIVSARCNFFLLLLWSLIYRTIFIHRKELKSKFEIESLQIKTKTRDCVDSFEWLLFQHIIKLDETLIQMMQITRRVAESRTCLMFGNSHTTVKFLLNTEAIIWIVNKMSRCSSLITQNNWLLLNKRLCSFFLSSFILMNRSFKDFSDPWRRKHMMVFNSCS